METREIENLARKIAEIAPMIISLDKTLTVTNNNLEHLSKEVSEVTADTKKIRKDVYGNGNPKGGLFGRLDAIERWMEGQIWFQRLIIALLVAEAVGIIWMVISRVLGS